MNRRFKNYINGKLIKLQIILDTPGAFRARREGCYFELYRMVYRLYAMGYRPESILDIGANRGMFTKCAHHIFPNAAFYTFEPLKDCFEELCKLQRIIDKLECFNVAVGDKSFKTVIRRSNYDYSSSLLEMADLHKQAFPYTTGEQLEEIKVQTLDAILSGRNIKRPLLIKLDVQGYESFVLAGAVETLKKTDYILCEMSLRSLYKGQALFDDIYQEITRNGFKFSGQMGKVTHPQTTEVLQIDGLFVRGE